jgi:xanthine dehydrogenase accessory factor
MTPRVAGGDEIRSRAEELRAGRTPFVAATVVRVERPTSARPGDRALVLADGTVVGFVGGECATASVQAQALAALAGGEPILLRITPSAGIPTPASGPAPGGAVTVHNPCLSGGTMELFLEPVVPPPLVVVHGTAPIATAVSGLAERLEYAVVPWAGGGISEDTAAVVVASHGRDEADVLVAALRAGVPYIGLVASRRRGAAVVAALDVDERDRARIRTPAGIDIGARTPSEVALSILAEIVDSRPRPDRAGRPGIPAPDATTGAAVDPVCGMVVATAASSPHADVDGARYWFCGSGCREAFLAGPRGFISP